MTDINSLESQINAAFEERASLGPDAAPAELRDAVEQTLGLLDAGTLRVAEPTADGWTVNEWAKKAVLLSFRLYDNHLIEGAETRYFDKVPGKYANYSEADFRADGVRVVPPAMVRRGVHIASNVVLMPSYVNIGARVGARTMVDTWATVGSCAQIGSDVHLSGGVGIGGVLEPPGARPVIVEDGCFIGSRAIVVEGVHVEREAVLGANVVLTASTPVIDVSGPEAIEHRGRVPARSVVIPGTRSKRFPAGEFQVACALIVGQRKASTDRRTSLNDALRDHGVQV